MTEYEIKLFKQLILELREINKNLENINTTIPIIGGLMSGEREE